MNYTPHPHPVSRKFEGRSYMTQVYIIVKSRVGGAEITPGLLKMFLAFDDVICKKR